MPSINSIPRYPPGPSQKQPVRDAPARWWTVTLAWLGVGIPLLWGVVQTLYKALALFR